MTSRLNRYVITALFGLVTLSTGCAARDVDVSHRGPIREKQQYRAIRAQVSLKRRRNHPGALAAVEAQAVAEVLAAVVVPAAASLNAKFWLPLTQPIRIR